MTTTGVSTCYIARVLAFTYLVISSVLAILDLRGWALVYIVDKIYYTFYSCVQLNFHIWKFINLKVIIFVQSLSCRIFLITVSEEKINRKRVVCRMTADPDFTETRTLIWGGGVPMDWVGVVVYQFVT